MPIHPAFTSRFPLLEGISSYEQGMADPEVQARIDQYASMIEAPPFSPVSVEDAHAQGPHGSVPVRIYRPTAPPRGRRSGLAWLHGGAFWAGDLDMPEADWVARETCARGDAVVVSVDYRLAVDGVTYPVPHDDAVAAIRWVRDNADALDIDPGSIVVGGASAGGNLATGAVLRLRDDDSWLPASLLLAYTTAHSVLPPASASLDALMQDVPPLLRFKPDLLATICRNYLGGPVSRADGYAMPANADLEGLCPVVMLNAEYDDLRRSSEAFAAQLAVAGVDVRQVMYRGLLHGFLNQPSTIAPVAAALELMAEVVANPLGAPR